MIAYVSPQLYDALGVHLVLFLPLSFLPLSFRYLLLVMKKTCLLLCSLLFAALLSLAMVSPEVHGFLGGLSPSNSPTRSAVTRVNAQLRGIDVSHHQGAINWKKVSDHKIGFCFIKATEGRTLVDKRLVQNLEGCRKNDLPRGAYHYYIFGADPGLQGRNFIARVPKKAVNLPPVIDLEYDRRYNRALLHSHNKKRFIREVRELERILRNHYGKEPIFYTNARFYHSLIKGNFNNPIWMCDLKSDELHYLDSSKWHFWQYSHTSRIPGISIEVDMNLYNGTRADFERKLLSQKTD